MYLQRDHADTLLQASLATIRERLHANLAFVTELLDGDDYRAEHCPGSRWVFCGKGGERLASINSRPKAVEEAGLEDFHFHDLRHTCGSWLVQAGVPLAEVKEILEHSTIKMTERYAHMAPENLRAAVDRLPGVPKSVHSALDAAAGQALST